MEEKKYLEIPDFPRDACNDYYNKHGFPPFESGLGGFFQGKPGWKVLPEEKLHSYYGEPITDIKGWVKNILEVHFPLLNEDGGREKWATDLEAMRIFVNHPYRKITIINLAIDVYNYSPYEHRYFDEENINWIRKAMQTYAKVSDNPIFQEVLDKYNWNE